MVCFQSKFAFCLLILLNIIFNSTKIQDSKKQKKNWFLYNEWRRFQRTTSWRALSFLFLKLKPDKKKTHFQFRFNFLRVIHRTRNIRRWHIWKNHFQIHFNAWLRKRTGTWSANFIIIVLQLLLVVYVCCF